MKIAIMGLGHVGKAIAFATVMRGLGHEINLISRDEKKAQAEALDLQHAAAMGSNLIKVSGGGVELARDSDVVLLCASVPLADPANPVRRDLTAGNAKLFSDQAKKILELSPKAIFVVVSNQSPAPDPKAIAPYVYDNTLVQEGNENMPWHKDYRYHLVVLVLGVVFSYIAFW